MAHPRLLLSASIVTIAVTASAASAQSLRFEQVDTDGNGLLSYDELSSAFGTSGADILWNLNSGNDLSLSDVRRINSARDDNDDDDDDGSMSDRIWNDNDDNDDDDDDGGSGGSSNDNDDNDDDDDDNGGSGGSSNDNDDDDDDDAG